MIEYQEIRSDRTAGVAKLDHVGLPPRNTTRWVARRKAQVVIAVETGRISLAEAMERYSLSLEEYQSWRHALDRNGIAGLRIAAAQEGRRRGPTASTPKLVVVAQ